MKTFLRLVLVFCLMVIPSCDWFQYSFINSLPLKGEPKNNPLVHVFLAIDGLSYFSVAEAQRRGYFTGKRWKLAKFISMFPGTSDASWTRILHTEPLPGYEYTYFDPTKDEVINKGYTGLIKHVIPTLVDGMSMEAPYLKSFDYRANGYLHSVGVYHDTIASLSESLDNLFYLLEGRAETRDTFSGYVIEIDALGHIFQKEDVQESLRILHQKIENFKSLHPEREFRFTILSDHGLDFVKVESKNLVNFTDEMKKVGVEPVGSLRGRDPEQGVYAVPVDHVRLTYLSFHTNPKLTEEVARRLSQLPMVDVAVGKMPTAGQSSALIAAGGERYGIWEKGKLIVSFSFVPSTNSYYLNPADNFSRFGLKGISSESSEPIVFSDQELFDKSKDSQYPDLFYRIRSGLSPVALKYPAEVLISLIPGYAALGFTLPWGDKDFSLAGFHGSLLDLGALGTLLTEEREIPDAVRSENFLSLFPEMQRNISEKGVRLYDGDRNALLKYR